MPKQKVAVELFLDGVWTDLVINDDVLAEQDIVINRGDSDEGAAVRPCSINLRLNNDDDMYRTSNPESPLYGKAGVNTPLRISVNSSVRAIAEVSSWRCGQTRDFRKSPRRGKAWTDIQANGLSWRINQWSREVESTMVKGMKSFGADLLGIWPLEDESSSLVLSQIVPGGFTGTYTGSVTFASSEKPGGSASSVQVTTGAVLSGRFIKATASGWQVSFAFKLAALPGSATYDELFYWYDSLGRRWTWEVNNANFRWQVYDDDGVTILASLAAVYSLGPPNQWLRTKMKVTVSGGTVTYEPSWYAEGGINEIGTSGTFASTSTGVLRSWTIAGNSYNNGGWYTGIFGIDDSTDPIFNAGTIEDFNGHDGETVGDRYSRIMGDLGLSFTVNGDSDLSTRMGAQNVDSLPQLLKEMRDTDDAILFDARSAIAMNISLRNFRYNQTAVSLDVTDDPSGFPNVPEEVTDDLPIHNIVTINNRNGGSVTVEDSTSSMGTQDPPDGRGEYRQTVNLNLTDLDTSLDAHANWWLRRGTVDLPRYPQVTLNLAAIGPSKITQVEAITVGTVFEIINYRENTIRLFVIGYTERIGNNRRSITYTCAPDQQFVTGIYSSTSSRWDSRSTVLDAVLTKVATSVAFRVTDAATTWSVTTPYDVMIGGECMTVTNMTVGALFFGGWNQTATVIRSVNGVFKEHDSQIPIHVATPGRWAL